MEQIFEDRFEIFNSREISGAEFWSLEGLGICGGVCCGGVGGFVWMYLFL